MRKILLTLVLSVLPLASYAALIGMMPATPGGTDWQVILDDDRDIMWMANANLALTNQFGLALSLVASDDTPNTVGSNGIMTWDNAEAWIAGMNNANYLGFNNWRQPATPPQDPSCNTQSGIPPIGTGFNCSGSDMGHLYYDELSGVAQVQNSILADPDAALFSNLMTTLYWSGTESSLNTSNAWIFGFNKGATGGSNPKNGNTFVWAVRDVSVVPVPAAVWLFGSGLLGLLAMARRQKAA